MEIWAKLFESAGRQVLVRKEANDDGDAAVKIEIPFSNGTACCVLGFETEAARDAVFCKNGSGSGRRLCSQDVGKCQTF